MQIVFAAIAIEDILAAIADQHVLAAAARERVAAAKAGDGVVAAEGVDIVAGARSCEVVGAICRTCGSLWRGLRGGWRWCRIRGRGYKGLYLRRGKRLVGENEVFDIGYRRDAARAADLYPAFDGIEGKCRTCASKLYTIDIAAAVDDIGSGVMFETVISGAAPLQIVSAAADNHIAA